MRNYLLLTPGPLSTSQTVREAMLQDWCTWDKDEQPAYRDACICDPAMRHAAALPAAVLSLPMDSELTDAEVERVTDAVCRYFADNESRYHE